MIHLRARAVPIFQIKMRAIRIHILFLTIQKRVHGVGNNFRDDKIVGIFFFFVGKRVLFVLFRFLFSRFLVFLKKVNIATEIFQIECVRTSRICWMGIDCPCVQVGVGWGGGNLTELAEIFLDDFVDGVFVAGCL